MPQVSVVKSSPGSGREILPDLQGPGGDCGQQRRQVPATPARNKGSEWPDLALLCKKEVEDVDLYVKSVNF